jgi:hypothetical protein
MKKQYFLFLALICLPGLMLATIFPKTGTAGLQFLKLGVDARAVGMGEAYTAVSDDISSVWWNPAGLALGGKKQIFFNHTNWPADIMHDFVAGSVKTDYGTLGLSVSLLHMDDMDVTSAETFGPTGETFSCYDLAAGLTYSKRLTDQFSFGLTGKYLHESLYEYDVDGFSMDFGTLFNTDWRNTIIGMSMRNFGPDMLYKVDDDGDGKFSEDPFDQLDNDGDFLVDEDREEMAFKLPLSFSLGVCTDIMRDDHSHMIASLQVDNCVDREETFNFGIEYQYSSLFVRSGYQFNTDTSGEGTGRPTAGLGWLVPVRFAILEIDWAYTYMGFLEEDFMSSAHRLSLKMSY